MKRLIAVDEKIEMFDMLTVINDCRQKWKNVKPFIVVSLREEGEKGSGKLGAVLIILFCLLLMSFSPYFAVKFEQHALMKCH